MKLVKKVKSEFKGPKRMEVDGRLFILGQVLVHNKTGNEFEIKEIQAAGFITYIVKTLGKKVLSTQRYYISHGVLNEYK